METAEARKDCGLIFPLSLCSLLKKILFLLLFRLATFGGSLSGTDGILILVFSSAGMTGTPFLSETMELLVILLGFPKREPCFPYYGLIVFA